MAAEGLDDHGGTTGLGDLRDPQGYSGNGNDAGMSPDTQIVVWSKRLCPEPTTTESNMQDADTETSEVQHHSQEMDVVLKPVPTTEDAQEGWGRNSLAIWINPKCIFLSLSQFVLLESYLSPPADPVPAQDTLISCSPTHQHIPCDNETRGKKK
ncbi:hypothetical protein HGM15179_008741 [Zosterops borbonicus]|uniref:Uncharacterized protein n=1 Tax=Zosterops borbonicus TaxID=364589 RepID=A0A8K1LLR6_9PASS|nr:hypothetical protein HGM15179_008741 [Zosterops borbonicus]